MIHVPGFRGAAFTTAVDGDVRQPADRSRISAALGIADEWATVTQVHGREVEVAVASGDLGEADAIVTTSAELPIAVFTADCLPIVLESTAAVATAHAGWRGMASGVIDRTVGLVISLDAVPLRAAIGPGIGPCCFEVGPEVLDRFPEEVHSETTWGTTSVDLVAEARRRLPVGVEIWSADLCTLCGEGTHSHRRDQTAARQAGIGWMP